MLQATQWQEKLDNNKTRQSPTKGKDVLQAVATRWTDTRLTAPQPFSRTALVIRHQKV